MDIEKLIRLCLRNEIRVDNSGGHKRTPPYYYDSLRHAFQFYWHTFITNNSSYNFYAQGLYGRNVRIFKRQVLDEDNTVLTLIAFERFFELFLKDLLKRVHSKLICYVDPKSNSKPKNTLELVAQIQSNTLKVKLFDGKKGSIPFKQTLQRFYDLIDYSKDVKLISTNKLIKKFARVAKKYAFLHSKENKATLQLLNWYRDKILHKGNELPSLWLLDYLITQRVVPVVVDILEVERKKLGESLFYLETITKINILDKLKRIKFQFKDLKSAEKQEEMYFKLLYIGHLKELGRANFNMNLHRRMNHATHEYSYQNPQGRGRRFAEIEKSQCPEAKEIKNCPCCGEHTLVVYRLQTDDIFNLPHKKDIDWIKCYNCDYYLWYNVYDPSFFGLNNEEVFLQPSNI